MSSNLYYLNDRCAVEAKAIPYEKEDDLQEIVAENPSLIIRPGSDPNYGLHLVSREFPIYSREASSTYAADHLFIDSDGVPVIVEVKRSSNNEIHRQVAAQMLDYASRLSSVRIETLKEKAVASAAKGSFNLSKEIWVLVQENLSLARMKMVFVADSLPDTLSPIIRFLDMTMPNIDVYGVSLQLYQTNDGRRLISRSFVTGEGVSPNPKAKPDSVFWNEQNVAAIVEDSSGGEAKELFSKVLRAFDDAGIQSAFGKGSKDAWMSFRYKDTWVFWLGAPRNASPYIELSPKAKAWDGMDILAELRKLDSPEYIKKPNIDIMVDLSFLGVGDNLARFISIIQNAPAFLPGTQTDH